MSQRIVIDVKSNDIDLSSILFALDAFMVAADLECEITAENYVSGVYGVSPDTGWAHRSRRDRP